MNDKPHRRKPRHRRARALLTVAAGAALAATIVGCGDDGSTIITNDFQRPDMAVPVDLRGPGGISNDMKPPTD